MKQAIQKRTLDMTEGSPLRIILLFTIPIILGNIFQQLYNIGDAKVVSFFLDEHAFAAVGMTAVVSNMLIGLINGFTQGFGIQVAHAFGAKDPARIRRNVAGSAVLTVLLTLGLSVLSFCVIERVLVLLHTPDALLDPALRYVRVILIGIPFSALYNLSANLLRSLGNSKTPLYCLLTSIFLNILLDILFVGVIRMGIAGAAYATVLSQAVCGGACFCYGLIRYQEYLPQAEDWRIDRSEYQELFLMGLSMGLMGCIVNIGTIILQSGINGLGAEIVAAHTAGRRLLEIMMSLIYTFGFTMTTYTSQNIGAGRLGRVRKGVTTANGIVTVISAINIVFAFLFARSIVSWIASTDIALIKDNATMYCLVGVCFFPVLGPLFVLRCTLQGLGRKVFPLVSSGLEFCIKVFSVCVLVPRLGYLGIALTEPLSWTLMTLILTVGYLITIRRMNF
ncbi:MAG: MATE family efflux transporter [Lachnospiraceae bacterium]|nr:MATE family efflux transporter [Lachnospiraceae bacterium]